MFELSFSILVSLEKIKKKINFLVVMTAEISNV